MPEEEGTEMMPIVQAAQPSVYADHEYMNLNTASAAKKFTAKLDELYKNLMQKGTDYGTLKGTEKPGLFKPGAELLARHIGFTTDSTEYTATLKAEGIIPSIKLPYIQYDFVTKVYYQGVFVGDGHGVCNSLEPRYAFRWMFGSEVPADVDKSELQTREIHTKYGDRVQYKVHTSIEEIFGLMNTIKKMAEKRSYVDAILKVTGASRIFTQDIEDLPHGPDDDSAPAEPAPEPKPDPKKNEESGKREAAKSEESAKPKEPAAKKEKQTDQISDKQVHDILALAGSYPLSYMNKMAALKVQPEDLGTISSKDADKLLTTLNKRVREDPKGEMSKREIEQYKEGNKAKNQGSKATSNTAEEAPGSASTEKKEEALNSKNASYATAAQQNIIRDYVKKYASRAFNIIEKYKEPLGVMLVSGLTEKQASELIAKLSQELI